MTEVYNYLPIDSISFGEQSVEEIVKLVGKEQAKDSIIVTSKSVSESSFFKKVAQEFYESHVYNNVSQHSPIEEINTIADDIKGKGVKFLISVGGGSVTDSVKIIRSKVGPQIPQIALPTTLSAAEFSHSAGYIENGEKKDIRGKELVPRHIYLDPNATLETPTTLWRSSGIRAIDHAIEATLGSGLVELRVELSKMSVEKMMANLEGNWTDKRQECQIASWYSYMDIFDSETGLSHMIGSVVGAKWSIPDGIASCITLPEMLRYYSEEPAKGLSRLATSLTGETEGTKAIEKLADKIDEFIRDLDLQKKFSEYGVKENDLGEIAEAIGQKDEKFVDHLRNLL